MCREAPAFTMNIVSSASIHDREVAPDPNFGLETYLCSLANCVKFFGTCPCRLHCVLFTPVSQSWISLFIHGSIGNAVVTRPTLIRINVLVFLQNRIVRWMLEDFSLLFFKMDRLTSADPSFGNTSQLFCVFYHSGCCLVCFCDCLICLSP